MNRSMKNTALAFSTAALVGLTAMPGYGNAILNGGFESGTGTDANNWNELEIAGGSLGATATTERSMADPLTDLNAMFLGVNGAADFGPVAEIQQQTLATSVTAGQTYDFSFQSKGVAGIGAVGFYEVQWWNSTLGPQGSATGLQNFALGGSYANNEQTNLVAPGSADSVFVSIRLVAGADAASNGTAFIDDVVFALQGAPPPAPVFPTVGNTVNNPGFEAGTGGSADNWTPIAGANGSVTRSTSMPANGAQAMNISFDNTSSAAPGDYFIQQVSEIGEVDDSEDYTLAFRAKAETTSFVGQNIFAEIQWLSSTTGFISSVQEGLIAQGLSTDYQEFIFDGLDAPDGADQYLVRFQIAAGADLGISNTLYVDDVYVGVVPEPSSLALLALGGLAMARRRRNA